MDRLAVYRVLAATGTAPDAGSLAGSLGAGVSEVSEGLSQLARDRHLALGDDSRIVMAHPFPAVPLGFSVTCVEAWLAATGSARGYVMDLGTLWRLAAHRGTTGGWIADTSGYPGHSGACDGCHEHGQFRSISSPMKLFAIMKGVSADRLLHDREQFGTTIAQNCSRS